MTLTTPSAYPTSVHSFAKAVVVIGVSGEGLHTTVQPAARAVVIFRTAITSG
jgi:adenylate kinase